MLEVILAGNPEAGRLEAEVRNQRYDLVAVVYEDSTGWHVEKHGSQRLPDDLLRKIKDELSYAPQQEGERSPRRHDGGGVFSLASRKGWASPLKHP
jgi:hypothetical protein